MIERSLWHPVIESDALKPASPTALRLLGEDLVAWRDGDGTAHVWADRCPHRGARLSMGRVLHGPGAARLECPYHGWQFDVSARCVAIPAQPEFVPPAGHRACMHDAMEAHGLVWARLEPGDTELPAFAAEADPQLRKLLCGPYDVATSAPRIVENFLDLAHFGLVHEGWLGDRAHLALAAYRVDSTPTGFVASGCRAWQPQSNRLALQGSEVEYRYELTAPYAAVLAKRPLAQHGYRDEIALFVCPIEPESSRVWFRLAVTDFDSSDEALRAFQQAIFTQDQPVLESQRPRRLPLSGGELHGAADRSSVAYRRLLTEWGIGFGVC